MVLREDLISKVRHVFGLNLYEAKIWLALLIKGVATAGELSDLADVPRSRAYDILESLEKKGFVIAKLGKPMKYMAVPPKEIINRLKKRYQEEVQKRISMLESLKESELIQELETLHQTSSKMIDVFERSGALRGRQNIYSHLETMFKEAEKSINIITTETAFIRKVDVFKPLFLELKDRGIKIRIITPINEVNAKYVRDLLEAVEIYDAGDIRGRVITVDGQEVLMFLTDDQETHPTNEVGIWIYAPFLAKTIDSLIEKSLDNLKPAKEKLQELNL